MKNITKYLVAGMIGAGSLISEVNYGQKVLSEDVFPKCFVDTPIDSAKIELGDVNNDGIFDYVELNTFVYGFNTSCYFRKSSKTGRFSCLGIILTKDGKNVRSDELYICSPDYEKMFNTIFNETKNWPEGEYFINKNKEIIGMKSQSLY